MSIVFYNTPLSSFLCSKNHNSHFFKLIDLCNVCVSDRPVLVIFKYVIKMFYSSLYSQGNGEKNTLIANMQIRPQMVLSIQS